MSRPPKQSDQHIIPVERIAAQIYVIRGQSVMLDSDLAELYGVSTNRLNEQVKRNVRRFPDDFSFQLTAEEALMSQFAISAQNQSSRHGPCAGEPHPQGVTLRGGVPCVGTPEIKARRFILAVRYHSEIGNPGPDSATKMEISESFAGRSALALSFVPIRRGDHARCTQEFDGR